VRARRVRVDDRVDRGGEALVLLGDRVVRVSELGMALLDSCPDWTDLQVLTERLVSRFGPPEDGAAATATLEALHRLHEQGLVDLG
jgi:hypothetical protein